MSYECDYYLKNCEHGGKCNGKHDKNPCLLFERDPRGKKEYMTAVIDVPFHIEIPNYNDKVEVVIKGIDKTITVLNIKNVKWNFTSKGLKGIHLKAYFSYWSDENGVITEKPKLKVIK